MIDPIKMVVGYDPREAVAYHVFCQTVLEKTTRPVLFLPLVQQSFEGYKETHSDGSNSFTYSRFLTPYLMNYRGWAIFADGDMVCNDDINKLWSMRDPQKAVQVVKHNYKTKSNKKYFGSKNEDYPRKNWSSLVLWNCEHPENRIIDPKFISQQSGSYLHRFSWLGDNLIGEIPVEWNWLAIEYPPDHSASLIHYTLGTPCFDEFRDSELAEHWHDALQRTLKGKTGC